MHDAGGTDGLLDDHVALAGPGARVALPATALRNRSTAARHVLARGALGPGGDLGALLAAARAGDRGWLRRRRRHADPGLLAGLAQTIALQEELPTDRADALALYALTAAVFGRRALPPAQQGLHAQLAYVWQGPRAARRLLRAYPHIRPAVRQALEADLVNPFEHPGRGADAWPARFAAGFPDPPPRLDGRTGVDPFDRLTTDPAAPVGTAHRVSVVVTAYRPGEGLLTAVRSVLAQSWTNVEVLVVDDASGPEYDPVLDAAERLGPRVRVLRQPVNAGTYAARNAGMAAADGEFVTFQDSDDWSHPRRLELQVRPLLDDPRAVASTSDGVSVTDRLVLTRPGVRRGRLNPSSLLLRRAAVLGRAGWFDAVRKAGDSEYIERVEAVFGSAAVHHVEQPLALIRLSGGSLSRAEIKAYWMHPARAAYLSAFRRWHADGGRLHRPRDGGHRPFAAPAHLTGGARPREFDVVVAADWRFAGGPQRAALAELRALRAAGHRVAVLHCEGLRAVHRLRRPLAAPVQRLLNAGALEQVLPGEDARAHLVIVRHPEAVQFAAGDGGIRARRVLVVADRAPARRDGTDRRWDPAAVTAAARRLFGTDPLWCPQDPAARAALRGAGLALTPYDLPAVAEPGGDPRPPRGRVPVVGVDLCDAGWPADVADALAVPRACRGADVRLRLPGHPLPPGSPEPDPAWLAYLPDDVEPRVFHGQLDVYLHFPDPGLGAVLSRPALEAAAAGCVVLAPEHLAAQYGDAAVYCPPERAPELVARWHADPAGAAEQGRRARAVVAAAYPPGPFVDRVAALLPGAAPAAPQQRSRAAAAP